MKTALLIGCGSKFGLNLLRYLLAQDWTVYSISGSTIDLDCSRLHQKIVDWKSFSQADLEKFLKTCPAVDLVFFNQNSSALHPDYFAPNYYTTLELWKQEKTWNQCYFVSCILPFHIIHTLGNRCNTNTRVAWMLSSYIYDHSDIGHADYLGNKYQNYVLMKNFAQHHPACFFGVNPDNLGTTDTEHNIRSLIDCVESANLNGQVIKFDGTTDLSFNRFTRDTTLTTV